MMLLLDFLSHNWAIVAIATTIGIIVLVPLLVILKYARISLNIMRTTKPPLGRDPLDYEPLIGERVSFPAFDGHELAGTLVRAPAGRSVRGLIIFAHEYDLDRASCARYCRALWEAGYEIFAFDFRGHGDSPGPSGYTPRQWVTDREVDDMRGAIAWSTHYLALEGRSVELGVVGISRGGATALLTAVEHPEIRAICCDGAFSTDSTIEHFMRRWAYIFANLRIVYENHPPAVWRFLRATMFWFARREFGCRFPSVRKAMRNMSPRALFFIHGARDSWIPVEESKQLFAMAAQPKYLWIAPNARHNEAAVIHQEQYSGYLRAFFDRHLGAVADDSTDQSLAAIAAPYRVESKSDADEVPIPARSKSHAVSAAADRG